MILLRKRAQLEEGLDLGDIINDHNPEVSVKRTPSDIPVLVNSQGFPDSDIKDIPVIGAAIGKPISAELLKHYQDFPEMAYLIGQILGSLRENTNLKVVVTSVDQSRTGKRRKNSEGHLAGSAIDIVFMITEEGQNYVILDLMDSVAFYNYLIHISQALIQPLANIGSAMKLQPVIIGCEYDHVHIEMPWSNRIFPSTNSQIRCTGVPSGIVLASFYNPQKQYGLSSRRIGDGEGRLNLLC